MKANLDKESSLGQPAGAGGQGHPASNSGVQVPEKKNTEEIVAKWIDDAIALAPPPEKVHVSTHLKSCIPALLLALK